MQQLKRDQFAVNYWKIILQSSITTTKAIHIERTLREEQTCFRSRRSCADQIFVLRTIVEQSLECNSSSYINYTDFEKAFDSVHCPSLWKILEVYGFPMKVINILSDTYADNQYCVRHKGQQCEWLQGKTGIQQGCVISPVLFLPSKQDKNQCRTVPSMPKEI